MSGKTVTIEGSGKHMHVSAADLAVLCGEGFELEVKKYLSQPGEFASNTRIDVVGPKGTLKGVSILGPCRPATQVELSLSDARSIGIAAPIRESGDVAGSACCTLIGPAGTLELKEGVIVAKRHVHFTPEDAKDLGIIDKQLIKIKVCGDRCLIFDEVVARVSPKYATYMHIDYDEMNAAGLSGEMEGEIIV